MIQCDEQDPGASTGQRREARAHPFDFGVDIVIHTRPSIWVAIVMCSLAW